MTPSRVVGQLLEVEIAQDLERLSLRLALDAAGAGQLKTCPHEVEVVGLEAGVVAGEDVFEHGHARPELDVLKGPRYASADDAVRSLAGDALASENQLAAVHAVEAADDVEERGL